MLSSRSRLAILAVIVFVSAAALGWFFFAVPRSHSLGAAGGAVVVDAAADLKLEHSAALAVTVAPAAVVPAGAVSYPPGRLIIRSIGVNAPVLGVGVDRSGAMAVTNESYDVGWFKLGPAPGDPGDAVIDGHLDWYDTSRAVFFNLKNMRAGDDIEVQRLDGVSHHFKVTKVQSVAYNFDPNIDGLFATTGPPRLSLITCGGQWDFKKGEYLQRVIVDSVLVS
jgi:sortase (surface protein transpeptidase)